MNVPTACIQDECLLRTLQLICSPLPSYERLLRAHTLPAVQARQEAIEWKRQRSWLPAGFLGELCSPAQQTFTG